MVEHINDKIAHGYQVISTTRSKEIHLIQACEHGVASEGFYLVLVDVLSSLFVDHTSHEPKVY